ncbi:MAG TPA: NYN domain-containing protein [Clostridiaceae bacterium]
MKIIFVDGYNVINSWQDLKLLMEVSMEASREKLVDIMQNYSGFTGNRVIIVYDGHLISGNNGSREERSNVSVIFTKTSETADNYIEKAVNKIGRKVNVAVVTSDNLEQQVVFQRGAARISAYEFYIEVKNSEDKIRKKEEKRYSQKRNQLGDAIEKSILEELEKIRRSH